MANNHYNRTFFLSHGLLEKGTDTPSTIGERVLRSRVPKNTVSQFLQRNITDNQYEYAMDRYVIRYDPASSQASREQDAHFLRFTATLQLPAPREEYSRNFSRDPVHYRNAVTLPSVEKDLGERSYDLFR